MIKKIALLFVFTFSLVSSSVGKDCFPEKSDSKLVYDEVALLTNSEYKELNDYLIKVSNQTSNQIVVVIVGDLCGMDKAMYATDLGHEWGVGRKGKDNGIVILVKPTGGKGQRKTFIAVGYGLEGVIPDATAKLIVENEMIPRFKQGDFYEGLKASLNVLVPLAVGEFNYVAYEKKSKKRSGGFPPMIFIIIGIVILSKVMGARNYAQQNGISLWSAFFMGSMLGGSFGGSGRRGGWDDFSSGGGGFGGFGGGGFGGGGAGGSW
ncbi:MAG: hypothetical protein ACJA0Q_001493 [Saprospiraceae bacterium]|jgi:uncharacterized protein